MHGWKYENQDHTVRIVLLSDKQNLENANTIFRSYDWEEPYGQNDEASISNITVLETKDVYQVDFNKPPFDGDLIVDFAQGSCNDYRIVWSKSNIGIDTEDTAYSECYDNYGYQLKESTTLDPTIPGERHLKIRILNYYDNTVDIELTASPSGNFLEFHGHESWWNVSQGEELMVSVYKNSETGYCNMYVWLGIGE